MIYLFIVLLIVFQFVIFLSLFQCGSNGRVKASEKAGQEAKMTKVSTSQVVKFPESVNKDLQTNITPQIQPAPTASPAKQTQSSPASIKIPECPSKTVQPVPSVVIPAPKTTPNLTTIPIVPAPHLIAALVPSPTPKVEPPSPTPSPPVPAFVVSKPPAPSISAIHSQVPVPPPVVVNGDLPAVPIQTIPPSAPVPPILNTKPAEQPKSKSERSKSGSVSEKPAPAKTTLTKNTDAKKPEVLAEAIEISKKDEKHKKKDSNTKPRSRSCSIRDHDAIEAVSIEETRSVPKVKFEPEFDEVPSDPS